MTLFSVPDGSYRLAKIVAGFVISLALIGWGFSEINYSSLLNSLMTTNLYQAGLSTLFFALSCFFRALGWRVTTAQYGEFKLKHLFRGIILGYLANNFIPLKGGELVRAHYLANSRQISFSASFSSVIIERIFDVIVLVLLIGIAFIFGYGQFSPERIDQLMLGLFCLLSGLVLMAVFLKFVKIPAGMLENTRTKLIIMIRQFIEPVYFIFTSQRLAILFLMSLGAWISNYFSLLVLLPEITAHRFAAALMLLLFLNIGLLIPSSPGSFGIMQLAFIMSLTRFQLPKESALALSFVYQAELYLFTILFGLPVLKEYTFSSVNENSGI